MAINTMTIKFFTFAICASFVAAASGQDTTFTYQGELKQNGNPSNGSFDMSYSLWDSVSNGNQIDTTDVQNGVSVADGRFTVELDFGAESFTNANRWLEIEVNGFTLDPRTRITRSPYSVQTRGIFVDDNEKVGMGTTLPESLLHLKKQTTSANFVERMLVIDSHDDPNNFNLQAGSGAGILFKVPYQSDSRVGAAIDAVRTNGGETNSSTDLSFSVSENNQVLNEAFRISATGESIVRGRMGLGGASPTFGQLNIADSGDGAVFGITTDWNHDIFPAILATNLGSGGVLWADGVSDVEPEGGGVIVVGNEGGANIGIDRNEIMARNNGQTSTLFLNADGGNIKMGTQQTHPAFAYGKVSSGGAIVSASNNVTSVQRIAAGRYAINVVGGAQSGDVFLVTSAAGIANAGVVSTHFELLIENVLGTNIDSQFNFVIYRP